MKKNEGEIKLITILVVLGIIVAILFIGAIVLCVSSNGKQEISESSNEQTVQSNSDDWKSVSLGEVYSEDETIELDLDGDGEKEKIDIKKEGKYIYINDVELLINKYYQDEDDVTSRFKDYSNNSFYFVDLNNDGIIEILHRTVYIQKSPEIRKFTIYNYKDGNIKEIGEFSLEGSLPHEVYVKNNKVKFEYTPDETPEYYKEKIKFELDL